MRGSLFLFLLVLVANSGNFCPAAHAQKLDPKNTYAVIVGVLTWEQNSLTEYAPAKRQDQALHQQLLALGVPEKNMRLLLDQEATRETIDESLKAIVEAAQSDSTLILYYAGHGMKIKGEGIFACYDIRTQESLKTGWRHSDIASIVSENFQGSNVLLFADCCFSGALQGVAETLSQNGLKAASLTSASSLNVSTNNWTYSMCLVDALKGNPLLDLDENNILALDELADEVQAMMANFENQHYGYSNHGLNNLELVATREQDFVKGVEASGFGFERGQFVIVNHNNHWKRARVLAARGISDANEDNDELLVQLQAYNIRPESWFNVRDVRVADRPELPPVPLGKVAAIEKASVDGKYETLLHTLECPEDYKLYGEFDDFGYWSSDIYKGHTNLSSGAWVYVYPNWYVWEAEPKDSPVAAPEVNDNPFVNANPNADPFADPAVGPAANPNANQRINLLEALNTAVQDFQIAEIGPNVAPWDASQMIGKPNTPDAGDAQTAWASLAQDDTKVWIELDYAKAVLPAQVHIYETFNPGAVYQVSAFTNGEEVRIWKGDDPTPAGSGKGVSKIDIQTKQPISRIRIYLDCPRVPGWNEIDAVGILDKAGRTHWATAARSSSNYSRQQPEIVFEDPFTTPEERQAEKIAIVMRQINARKEQARILRRQLDEENAAIRKLYEELDAIPNQ